MYGRILKNLYIVDVLYLHSKCNLLEHINWKFREWADISGFWQRFNLADAHFLNFLQGLNLPVRHLSHKIPGISSHLLYPNLMIDVLIIYNWLLWFKFIRPGTFFIYISKWRSEIYFTYRRRWMWRNHQVVIRKRKPVGKSLCVSSILTAEERSKKAGNKVESNH